MSKGPVSDFIGLYRGILKDIADKHPTLSEDCDRDLSRLIALSSTMGISVFTLLLPDLDKLLCSSLDQGRLPRTGLPLSRSINTRTTIPRLFRGMWLRIFELSGCLKQDIDPDDVRLLRTLLSGGKKYRAECPDAKVFASVKEFFNVDEALPPPSPIWDGDGSDLFRTPLGSFSDLCEARSDQPGLFERTEPDDSRLLDLVQHIADRIAVLLGDYVPSEWRFRHGPGAVSDLQTGRGYKYQFPGWSPRLQRVFPAEVFAIANTSVLGSDWDLGRLLSFREHHSKLVAVPKTMKGPRLIAAEPTCHQWCQQSVKDFLTDRIKHTWLGKAIDFSNQELSGQAALAASSSGSHATIDLSSASDRISAWAVQRFFRRNIPLLEALIATRTRYVRNDVDTHLPSLHKVRKFSTMGSALTFPIQSIFFLAICISAGASLGRGKREKLSTLARQVRVYGDDLIVPVAWVPRVVYILNRLYLKVNVHKSFWNGQFRESCGTDAFRGHDVTPTRVLQFYSESSPSSLVSVVDVHNNFYIRGYRHAAAALISAIPGWVRKHLPVVQRGAGSFGLYGDEAPLYLSGNRWNKDLHRWEVRAFSASAESPKPQRHEGFSNLLQYFTEDPSRPGPLQHMEGLATWTSGVFEKPKPMIRLGWVPVR